MMEVINIHAAKTHLSKLVERAALGEPFIIAKAGKPMVKVSALDGADARSTERLGFMAGEIDVPDDFDRMADRMIEQQFEGDH